MTTATKTLAEQYVTMCIEKGLALGGGRGNTSGQERIGCRMDSDGAVTVYHEWYVDESMDDDDLSTGGYSLPPKPGLTRVGREWTEAQYDTIPAATTRIMQAVLAKEAVDPAVAEAVARRTTRRDKIESAVRNPANFCDVRLDHLSQLWTGEFGGSMYGDATRLVWRDGDNTWELVDADLAAEASTLSDD